MEILVETKEGFFVDLVLWVYMDIECLTKYVAEACVLLLFFVKFFRDA